jgi:hypothetical protein
MPAFDESCRRRGHVFSSLDDPGCVKTLRGITAPGILSPTIHGGSSRTTRRWHCRGCWWPAGPALRSVAVGFAYRLIASIRRHQELW